MASNFKVLVKVIGITVAIALSFVILKFTGLYNAAEATFLKAGLGFALASWFILNFSIALYEKRYILNRVNMNPA